MDAEDEIVYLVDDNAAVRTGLARLLRSAGYAVEAFASAETFLAHGHRDTVGCLVLDVRMPGLDGLELQAELVSRDTGLPIIFLTGHGDIPMTVAAMKQGARDFLTKPVDEQLLLGAVEKALQTHRAILAERQAADAVRARLSALTPRELEVLRWIITGARNKHIAARLGIAEQTVKIHRARIMEKTGARSPTELIKLCDGFVATP
jgi:FixJ family two-component response regulator